MCYLQTHCSGAPDYERVDERMYRVVLMQEKNCALRTYDIVFGGWLPKRIRKRGSREEVPSDTSEKRYVIMKCRRGNSKDYSGGEEA